MEKINASKNYKDVIYRLGYYRNKNNLSAREASLRLGYSDSFINRIERFNVELKLSTLLEFLELVEINPFEFFYPNPENFKEDKQLIESINNLSKDDKDTILELVNKLGKKK